MQQKSTVAISLKTRLRLKKLAALLNRTQGDIVDQAINDYEKKILATSNNKSKSSKSKDMIEKILDDATKEVWDSDPIHKELQQRLMKGGDTIDDYIIKEWNGEFEE